MNDGKCILFQNSVKLLGGYFDSKLKFSDQINKVVSSCYNEIRKISSIRKYISSDQCEQLAHALIYSKIDYINSLYFGLPKYLLQKLQKVQNASLRLIQKLRKNSPVSHLYLKFHWLNIEQKIIFKISLFIFKCLNGLAPISLSSNLLRKSTFHPDCYSLMITTFARSEIGKRSFTFYAPRLWNPLPMNIRSITSIDTFKSSLKSYLLIKFHEYKQLVNSIITLI